MNDRMRTVTFRREQLLDLRDPPFQRPFSENKKVVALKANYLAQAVGGGPVKFPGVLTLGLLDGMVYKLDGQHRTKAFLATGLGLLTADVRTMEYTDMKEMGEEWVRIQGQLVRTRPDDFLRAIEDANPSLRFLREQCPFIGYGNIKRSDTSPVLSMFLGLTCWMMSMGNGSNVFHLSAVEIGPSLTMEMAQSAAAFFAACWDAWGNTPETNRLWNRLNLFVCAYLYHNMVEADPKPRIAHIDTQVFAKCMMSVSASSRYLDWLVGRPLNAFSRSRCFQYVKEIVASRLKTEGVSPIGITSPFWASDGNSRNNAAA